MGPGRGSSVCLLVLLAIGIAFHGTARPRTHWGVGKRESCETCHQGIESMHPWYELTCTACHGGDGTATDQRLAHVSPRRPPPADERLWPQDHDDAYVQFLNPSDLRVVHRTCYECHTELVDHLRKSLHATTAGHLSDSLYENGLTDDRRVRYSIFAVADEDGEIPEHGYESMPAFPQDWSLALRGRLAGHVADLGRKNCMQCHLWSEGTAIRGRLGQDGDYRGSGCAACHVTYADNGLSESADPTVDPFEPGHPRTHSMTAHPPTATCTRCHYGDASIGLHFRGLAQLVPGMPAGPDVPGTTDAQLNRTFYLNDPKIVPPDIHHEKGMHCIDCHTLQDVMGDGNLYGFMEHAVEIECVDCHGTLTRPSNLQTSRGRRLDHLQVEDGRVVLVSKVDGKKHYVPQATHVIDSQRPEFNADAAEAMNRYHHRLECYSCHAGWNVNFFGFHFDRNESFTDLDLFLGERTPGRCSTQEKVFATLRQFYLGFNDEGMIAPYLVGFSTMGTVHDETGTAFIDQQLPVTAAGLSGMTMIHHQLHSTRGTARSCVECHRSSATYGMGSGNFHLTRSFAAVTDELGLHLVAMNRNSPELSTPVSSLALPNPGRVAAVNDILQGHFVTLFVVLKKSGVAVIDARNPAFPERLAMLRCDDPRDLVVRSEQLYVADGRAGIKIFDVETPKSPKLLATVPTREARGLALSWPHLYVADGEAGVRIFDVTRGSAPDFVGHLDLNGDPQKPDTANAVAVTFQYSRPDNGQGQRTLARKVAVIAGGPDGVIFFDVTDPAKPELLSRFQTGRAAVLDVVVGSRFDLGSAGGEIPTEEHDYAYAVAERGTRGALVLLKFTDPKTPKLAKSTAIQGGARHVRLASFYNAPFLQRFAVVANSRGTEVVDVSAREQADVLGPLFSAAVPVEGIALEEFSLDRMIDERGRPEKDISHEGARFLLPSELERVLQAEITGE